MDKDRAETDAERLEHRKLELEVETLEKNRLAGVNLIQLVPVISLFLTVLGYGWGVHTYQEQQRQNREQEIALQQKEQEAAQREAMKPWLEAQRETYREALSAAGTLSCTTKGKEQDTAKQQFFTNYYGPMVLVETKPVSKAMVKFGHCFDGTENCSQNDIHDRCLELGTVMKKSMAATSKMSYDEFKNNQFEYKAPESLDR